MIYKSIISIRQFQEHIIGDGSGGCLIKEDSGE